VITSNTEIQGTKITHTIKYEVCLNEIYNVISFLEEYYEIVFKTGDTETDFKNLLDDSGLFKFDTCETMFSLSMLETISHNGNCHYILSGGYKEVYKKFKRTSKINQVI